MFSLSSFPSVRFPSAEEENCLDLMDVGDMPTYADAPRNAAEISVVLPTFNERDNIAEVIARLGAALHGLDWELIFVDDNSPDGTSGLVRLFSLVCPRIRLIERIGRRGLSSACIEGMRAATAEHIAIMDADLQHDETALPAMLVKLRTENLDMVVGTRNSAGGSMGDFSPARVVLSRLGKALSYAVSHSGLSDPMSGFFIVRRGFFLEVMDRLDGRGFKLLLDMLASSARRVRLGEVGYRFRNRYHGESKLGPTVIAEYLLMIAKKLASKLLSMRPLTFAGVGTTGAILQLGLFYFLYRMCHGGLVSSQIVSILAAILANFALNNRYTFHDYTVQGAPASLSLLLYCNISCIGACLNILTSLALMRANVPWQLAGIAGIAVGAVWNYGMSVAVVWKVRRRKSSVKPITSLEPTFLPK